MGNPKGVKRDFAALEQRRLQAVKLFERGRSKAEVARQFGVSNESAGRWHKAWKAGGRKALKHSGQVGRKSRLQPLDRVKLAADLQRGPQQTLGYATALWTLPRIVALIGQEFGCRYSTSQARRALERDDKKIRLWKERRWPAIKKKPVNKGEPSSFWTKAG